MVAVPTRTKGAGDVAGKEPWGTQVTVSPPLALKPGLWKSLALLIFAISPKEPAAGANRNIGAQIKDRAGL